jgi:putative ABC transport system permease protein
LSIPVEEQRADVRPDRGGVPTRRAMARWAWRLFRREWRQQLLVLALITIAVMATILGAAIGTNTPPPGNATFGTADYLATLPGSDTHLAADLKKITTRFSPAEVIENESLTTGSVPIELRAQNPNGPYLRQTLALVSGHYPTGTSHVGDRQRGRGCGGRDRQGLRRGRAARPEPLPPMGGPG